MFLYKIRYVNRNILEISHLSAFLEERGNDLATVSNSVICDVFLSNNSLLQRYMFYWYIQKNAVTYLVKSNVTALQIPLSIIRSVYILFKFQISFTALTILLRRLSMLDLSQTGCSLSVTNSIISFC